MWMIEEAIEGQFYSLSQTSTDTVRRSGQRHARKCTRTCTNAHTLRRWEVCWRAEGVRWSPFSQDCFCLAAPRSVYTAEESIFTFTPCLYLHPSLPPSLAPLLEREPYCGARTVFFIARFLRAPPPLTPSLLCFPGERGGQGRGGLGEGKGSSPWAVRSSWRPH